jgi:GTP-binding protein EngB required for normal cell division
VTGHPVLPVTQALDALVELSPGRCSDEALAGARALREQLDERLGRGEWFTVAALTGGTGVGKSALFNAVIGRDVALEGVRRPTTSVALAALRRPDASSESLLDWLEIPQRLAVGEALPEGLILLDLPDHDSVVDQHRHTAARLAQRVDVVLWVLDPLKYARADAHEGTLADLTAHAGILLVVLNRVDELTSDAREACIADLHALLAARGHDEVRVIATSAATGEGVDELSAVLRELVGRRDAARRRLAADAAVLAERFMRELDALPELRVTAEPLLPAVLDAADGHRIVADAFQRYRSDARRACRSPLARLAHAPVRVVRSTAAGMGLLRAPARLPGSEVTASRVEAVLIRAFQVDQTVGRVYGALNRAIGAAASTAAPGLLDAVASAGVDPGRRRWWPVLATARGLAEATALVGIVWLVLLSAAAWLQLPEIPVPEVRDGLPLPTALVLLGAVVRAVLGVGNRWAIAVGARRHADAVDRALRRRALAAIEAHLLRPVREELQAHRRLHDAVAALAAADTTPRLAPQVDAG